MKATHEQKLELYNQGFTDMEIAQQLKITQSCVNIWRRNNSLPNNGKGVGLTKEEEQKRIDLYNRGFQDVDIAKKCGVFASSIYSWRRDRGLKSNSKGTLGRRGYFSWLNNKVFET